MNTYTKIYIGSKDYNWIWQSDSNNLEACNYGDGSSVDPVELQRSAIQDLLYRIEQSNNPYIRKLHIALQVPVSKDEVEDLFEDYPHQIKFTYHEMELYPSVVNIE